MKTKLLFFAFSLCLSLIGKSQPCTVDPTFNNLGSGPTSTVITSVIQNDGKILIGGNLSAYNGVSTVKIARINDDGSLDTGFNTGNGATGSMNQVNSINVQNDGKVIVAGRFTGFNGTLRSCITRLNSNGTNDLTFNPGTGAYQSDILKV